MTFRFQNALAKENADMRRRFLNQRTRELEHSQRGNDHKNERCIELNLSVLKHRDDIESEGNDIRKYPDDRESNVDPWNICGPHADYGK